MAAAAAGPTLVQILWSALDRVPEPPALVDCADFADRIAGAFVADTPSERWVARFFEGNPELRKRAPSDMAQAIVQASRERMHVYEFDLDRLEYVVLEEEQQVVVVSGLGQFAFPKDDRVTSAIETAVVSPERARRVFARTEPRAFLVKPDGRLVALDPARMARALAQLDLRQRSLPAVARPLARLEPFHPQKRELTREREILALRENDPRTKRPLVEPSAAREPAALVALPDGSLPQPEIGAASRWREMVSDWSQGASLIAARDDLAPIGVLADDDLARAVSGGARFVPALGAAGVSAQSADAFWIQPDMVLATEDRAFADGVAPHGFEAGAAPWSRADMGDPSDRRLLDFREGSLAPRRESTFRGSQLLPVRAPDGTLVHVPDAGTPLGRESAVASSGAVGAVPAERVDEISSARAWRSKRFGRASRPLADRSGAIPAPALATLQFALERTASAGAYQLPPLRTLSAPDAVGAGARMSLPTSDPRRHAVRLAGPAVLSGPVARLVLSMPFPAGSTVHVGRDLSDALSDLVSTLLAPAAAATSASEHSPTTKFRAEAGAFALPDLLPRAALAESVGADAQPEVVASSRAAAAALSEELVARPPARDIDAPIRPLGLGEDEIVIPLPLWAQLGRERRSSRPPALSSPPAALGFEPPLGIHRLVVPSAFRALPNEEGNPPPPTARLVGPTALELVSVEGRFETQRTAGLLGDAQDFSTLPWDERSGSPLADDPVVRRGRVGAPLHPDAARAARSRAPAGPRQELAIPPVQSSPANRAFPPGPVALADVPGAPTSGAAATAREHEVAAPAPRASSGAVAAEHGRHTSWASAGVAQTARTVAFSDVAALDRAWQPALPAGLRFRYAGSPLWWSRSLRREDHAAPEGDEPRSRRSGLFAAGSGAAMWRSILVSGAGEEPAPRAMSGWDGGAGELAAAGARGDAMAAAALARGTATASSRATKIAGPETVYLAIDEQGSAGPVLESGMAPTRQKIDALQMSIVAAIPPAPPPLEAMGAPAAAAGSAQAHPRRRPDRQDDEDDDAVSHSKIEGSVDAVAQRIYHRIRRRIESDRERFGG